MHFLANDLKNYSDKLTHRLFGKGGKNRQKKFIRNRAQMKKRKILCHPINKHQNFEGKKE